MFYWTPVSRRHPLSAVPVSAPVASSSFLNFNQPGVQCCLLEGGWASRGVTSSDWLRVSIKYSAWPTHSPPVARWCILRRHEALTAARGADPALHSSHVAVSPFIIRLMRRTQAVQSISASPFSFYRPPPSSSSSGQPLPALHLSTLRLMWASSFSVSPLTPRRAWLY